jgi:peptide/nickel transport system substrate-binding protein
MPLPAAAATLRVTAAGDAGTLDPHSQNIIPTAQLLRQIYEPLVNRGPKLELEPALAESWSTPEPNRWRFKLRAGVTFQDGAKFTADDVVFSLQRAAAKTSNYSNFVDSVDRAEAVDPLTVDVFTTAPDPILVDKLASIVIMSRAWANANHAEAPLNAAQGQEAFTARHTNGTGPFRLVSREENVRTVLERNPAWWGTPTGNVTQYVSLPVANAATRVAAFLSGEIDVLLDPPLQAIDQLRKRDDVKILQGPEIRTMFIVMDQGRDELLYSDVKGKNPFKDRRVRQALYQATDIEAIRTKIERDFALPTGLLFGPGVRGYAPDIDTRLPLDLVAAKALLSEAGYPQGFGVTLDCPNNRYVNDADVCAALASMWARIGVRVSVNAQPLQTFFPKIQRRDTSMYFLGSGSATLDAFYMFQIHLMPPGGRPGDGVWNLGGYNNPDFTRLAERIRGEIDMPARDKLIRDALLLVKNDIANLPLYHQEIAWAVRGNIDMAIRADNQFEAKWVTVK